MITRESDDGLFRVEVRPGDGPDRFELVAEERTTTGGRFSVRVTGLPRSALEDAARGDFTSRAIHLRPGRAMLMQQVAAEVVRAIPPGVVAQAGPAVQSAVDG